MPSTASTPSRLTEILAATDELIRVHNAWESDAAAPIYPTADFERAVEHCIEALRRGDIPQPCLQLANALNEFDVQWQLYANGNHRSDGTPYSDFWAAFRAVLDARHIAHPQPPKYVEPVAQLRAQGVSDRQIAHHIYGHNGTGPFLDNGQIRSDLIDQEARDPGSVLGAERWIHPSERERQQRAQVSHAETLAAVDERYLQDAGDQAAETHAPTTATKGRRKKFASGPSPAVQSAADPVPDGNLADLVQQVREENPDKSADELVDILRNDHDQTCTVIQVMNILRQQKP